MHCYKIAISMWLSLKFPEYNLIQGRLVINVDTDSEIKLVVGLPLSSQICQKEVVLSHLLS